MISNRCTFIIILLICWYIFAGCNDIAEGIAIIYSTYLGGSHYDMGDAIAVDVSGNYYVAGRTHSINFPTLDAYQETYIGDGTWSNVFITKFNSSGNIEYSTYFGGFDLDQPSDIAIDDAGNAFLTGWTASADFPTKDAYQGLLGGMKLDAFLVRIDTDGSLLFSSYLGGSIGEVGHGIALDVDGSIYVTGYTYSSDFPTLNAYQTLYKNYCDGFVTKFDSTGKNLVYSTYLGGTDCDEGYAITVSEDGSAYIAGHTKSVDFPTLTAYQSTLSSSGYCDVFVAKLSATGDSLIQSTYFGGALKDYVYGGITLDAAGNVYVSGVTFSTGFPTINAFQKTTRGMGDGFIAKFTPTMIDLVYSTFLGGSDEDFSEDMCIDYYGNVYVTGRTLSTDFPTILAYQKSLAGSASDCFLSVVNDSKLFYSTYFGGTSIEHGLGIALDNRLDIYVTGVTCSADFPTVKAYQCSYGGGITDAFIFKNCNPAELIPTPTPILTMTPIPTPTDTPTAKPVSLPVCSKYSIFMLLMVIGMCYCIVIHFRS